MRPPPELEWTRLEIRLEAAITEALAWAWAFVVLPVLADAGCPGCALCQPGHGGLTCDTR